MLRLRVAEGLAVNCVGCTVVVYAIDDVAPEADKLVPESVVVCERILVFVDSPLRVGLDSVDVNDELLLFENSTAVDGTFATALGKHSGPKPPGAQGHTAVPPELVFFQHEPFDLVKGRKHSTAMSHVPQSLYDTTPFGRPAFAAIPFSVLHFSKSPPAPSPSRLSVAVLVDHNVRLLIGIVRITHLFRRRDI